MDQSIYQTTGSDSKTFNISENIPLTYKIIIWTLVIVVFIFLILICVLWGRIDDNKTAKNTIKEITEKSYKITQDDLDKKLIFTYSDEHNTAINVTVPKNISGWTGNIIVQPKYNPAPKNPGDPHQPQQINLFIEPAYDLFLTELNDGISSYDGMEIKGLVHLESKPEDSSPKPLNIVTYYLNMGFINNKVYIQGLTGIVVSI